MKRKRKLNRKQKMIRNFIVTAVMLFLLTLALEFGSLSPEGAFHRVEKQYLVNPSRVIFKDKIENYHIVGYSSRLQYIVGVGDHHIAQSVAHYAGYGTWEALSFATRQRERVVAMPVLYTYASALDTRVFNQTQRQDQVLGPLHVMVYSEVSAAWAQLSLDFRMKDKWVNGSYEPGDIYVAQATPEESGLYFFTLGLEETNPDALQYFGYDFHPDGIYPYSRGQSWPAVISFYDASGQLIETHEVTVQ